MRTLFAILMLCGSAWAATPAPYQGVKDAATGKLTSALVLDAKGTPLYAITPDMAEWAKFTAWNAANGSPYDTSKILTPKTEAELATDISKLAAADLAALQAAILARELKRDPTLIGSAGLTGKLSDTK